jgi:hypothetical protein
MTGRRRATLFDRQIEAVTQRQQGKVPVYLTRQDWSRLWTHLSKGGSHLPITVRLIAAIAAELDGLPTETNTEREGK